MLLTLPQDLLVHIVVRSSSVTVVNLRAARRQFVLIFRNRIELGRWLVDTTAAGENPLAVVIRALGFVPPALTLEQALPAVYDLAFPAGDAPQWTTLLSTEVLAFVQLTVQFIPGGDEIVLHRAAARVQRLVVAVFELGDGGASWLWRRVVGAVRGGPPLANIAMPGLGTPGDALGWYNELWPGDGRVQTLLRVKVKIIHDAGPAVEPRSVHTLSVYDNVSDGDSVDEMRFCPGATTDAAAYLSFAPRLMADGTLTLDGAVHGAQP